MRLVLILNVNAQDFIKPAASKGNVNVKIYVEISLLEYSSDNIYLMGK